VKGNREKAIEPYGRANEDAQKQKKDITKQYTDFFRETKDAAASDRKLSEKKR